MGEGEESLTIQLLEKMPTSFSNKKVTSLSAPMSFLLSATSQETNQRS